MDEGFSSEVFLAVVKLLGVHLETGSRVECCQNQACKKYAISRIDTVSIPLS